MNDSAAPSREHRSWSRAILWGGILAATIDFVFASTYYAWLRDKPATRVWQSVAAGLLGKASFDGGTSTVVLGVILHYLIGVIWASIYVVTSRPLRILIRQPLASGVVFGAIIYLVMNVVVLPLSALHLPAFPLSTAIWPIAIHVLGIGPAIAFSAQRFLK
jgi:uncharacterized membrane protein YagU involved in acid resistance